MSLEQDLDVVVVVFDVLALDGLVEFECFVVAVEFVAAVVVALVVFAGGDSVTMLTEYVVFVTFVGYLRSE